MDGKIQPGREAWEKSINKDMEAEDCSVHESTDHVLNLHSAWLQRALNKCLLHV